MADTLKDKLSKAVKPGPQTQRGIDAVKNYVGQAKALVAPIDKATVNSIGSKSDNVGSYNKQYPASGQAQPNSYKKGGKVKKGGMAKVHKGERVLTKKQSMKFEKKGGFGKLYGSK